MKLNGPGVKAIKKKQKKNIFIIIQHLLTSSDLQFAYMQRFEYVQIISVTHLCFFVLINSLFKISSRVILSYFDSPTQGPSAGTRVQ